MTDIMRPATADDLAGIIRDAAATGRRLEIRGGGTLAACGAPREAAILDLRAFAGVVDYDPAELVLTVGPGTPLAQVQALVADAGQALPFDPVDCGPILGNAAGRATIGGVVAAGIAGSLRLSGGGARDHVLGFKAVSGRGEVFSAGARVVKNVTGYDLPKLAAASWGRLFAMTQVTLKVLPAPRVVVSGAIDGLDFAQAQRAMACALASAAMPAAAAYLPARHGVSSRTVLRLQGMEASVAARFGLLAGLLAEVGTLHRLADQEGDAAWHALRTLEPLSPAAALWRINVPPSRAAGLVGAIAGDWMADWGGGLIWMASDEEPTRIRALAGAADGHALLMRGSEPLRRSVPMLHPAPAPVGALEARLRRSFDPAGVFETGRFLDDGQ